MKGIVFILAINFIIATAFYNKHSGKPLPVCVETKIKTFSNAGNSCETGASVKEYNFQGKTVYVFDKGRCNGDLPSEVIDTTCNLLGTLGGTQGNTKINGVDFSKAVYVQTVWAR